MFNGIHTPLCQRIFFILGVLDSSTLTVEIGSYAETFQKSTVFLLLVSVLEISAART